MRDENKKNLALSHPSSFIPHPLIRVFCAVELPADVRARAAEQIARLREAVPNARASWERAEKMHITLKFLGEIEAKRVPDLSGAARSAAAGIAPFALSIEGAGAFPPRGVPRVLWLGVVDSSGGLTRLQQRLEEECALAGFSREAKRFHPHLTLARIRAPHGARALAKLQQEKGFAAVEFAVKDLIVIRSELGPGGSRYTEISRHELEAVPPH